MTKIVNSVAILIGLTVSGCAQYADLYITSKPWGLDLWSGVNGQYLGRTPTDVRYTRSPFSNSDVTQVVFFQGECYQSEFKVVLIDKWERDWNSAIISENTLYAEPKAIPGCTTSFATGK